MRYRSDKASHTIHSRIDRRESAPAKKEETMKATVTLDEVKACRCCYNCNHWNVDHSLLNTYLFNSCKENDTGGLINSPATWCCGNFTNKTGRELLPNVFDHPDGRGRDAEVNV